jgi:hypothetical protein
MVFALAEIVLGLYKPTSAYISAITNENKVAPKSISGSSGTASEIVMYLLVSVDAAKMTAAKHKVKSTTIPAGALGNTLCWYTLILGRLPGATALAKWW